MQVPSRALRGYVKQRAFYTNFEIVHVPTFVGKMFRNFANAVDESLAIYVYRCVSAQCY
jgi:hypothetical protein